LQTSKAPHLRLNFGRSLIAAATGMRDAGRGMAWFVTAVHRPVRRNNRPRDVILARRIVTRFGTYDGLKCIM